MKDTEQRQKDFRSDLAKLLDKHGADMDLEEEAYYGGRSHICVTMMSIFDDEGEITHDYCEFEL